MLESLICQATIHIISAESGVCEMVFVDTHDKESIMKKVNSNYGFITGRSICKRVIVEYGFIIKSRLSKQYSQYQGGIRGTKALSIFILNRIVL